MTDASAAAVFLVVFREALEAGLIIGIILTALYKLEQTRFVPHVLLSVLAALGLSVFAGFGLMSLTEAAQGNAQKLIEGFISIAACGVLTYMIFWMEEESRHIKSRVEQRVEEAVTKGEIFAFISLPFLAVLREGAETVLFLNAIGLQYEGHLSFWGAITGLLSAAAIAVLIFVGGRRVPIKPLFKWTGFFLLFISAGLLAYGIHELQEVGIIPFVKYPVWDINWFLNDKEGIGAFLKALFGYNGNPSLIEVSAYFTYLISIFILLRKKGRIPQRIAVSADK